MRYSEDAYRLLVSAEDGLRQLMEQALAEQSYSDVAHLASVADGVAALLRSTTSHQRPAGKPAQARAQASVAERGKRSVAPSARSSRRSAGKYPRFEREGDRLVKIGWSKKKGQPYEHRAPRTVVAKFREHLAERVKPGAVFTMEDVLPVPDGNGGEVPSYQAYLTLAWLRHCDAVRRKGRDGYAYTERAIDQSAVESLWMALPERT